MIRQERDLAQGQAPRGSSRASRRALGVGSQIEPFSKRVRIGARPEVVSLIARDMASPNSFTEKDGAEHKLPMLPWPPCGRSMMPPSQVAMPWIPLHPIRPACELDDGTHVERLNDQVRNNSHRFPLVCAFIQSLEPQSIAGGLPVGYVRGSTGMIFVGMSRASKRIAMSAAPPLSPSQRMIARDDECVLR